MLHVLDELEGHPTLYTRTPMDVKVIRLSENTKKSMENPQKSTWDSIAVGSTITCGCYLLHDFVDEMRQLPMYERYDIDIQKGYVIPPERKTKFVAKDIVKKAPL